MKCFSRQKETLSERVCSAQQETCCPQSCEFLRQEEVKNIQMVDLNTITAKKGCRRKLCLMS